MDKEKNRYLKRFHTLLGKSGGNVKAKKEAILAGFGVGSSRELDAHQLLEACAAIERYMNPELARLDKQRKQLIAAIGGWLKAMNKDSNIDLIKAIACRAAETDNFNSITPERLRSLYYAFGKKQKDLAFVKNITHEEVDYLTSMN